MTMTNDHIITARELETSSTLTLDGHAHIQFRTIPICMTDIVIATDNI
jgi:hypothetical protein